MTTNAGDIEYTVGADVKPLLSGAKQADKALDGMQASAKGLDAQTTKLSQSVKKASADMGRMRGIAGNLGFQLQDVAVQLQSGTNAMVVLGQQGSQFAGAFGPGGAIIGAIIAVSSALATAFLPALFDTEEQLEELVLDTAEMTKGFDELTAAQQRFVRAQVSEQVKALTSELNKLENEAESLKRILSTPSRSFIESDQYKEASQRLLEVEAQADKARQSIEDLTQSTDDQKTRVNDLIKSLQLEADTFGKSNAERAVHIARLLGAAPEEIAEIERIGKRIDLLQQEKEARQQASKEREASIRLSAREAEQEEREKERLRGRLERIKGQFDERIRIEQEYQQQVKDIRAAAEVGFIASEQARLDLEKQADDNRIKRLEDFNKRQEKAAEKTQNSWQKALGNVEETGGNAFAATIAQTRDFEESVKAGARAVGTDLVGALIKFVAQQAISKAAQLAGITAITGAQVASGAAITSVMAPAAAATSVATAGAAPALGLSALAAAIPAALALFSTPGRQTGGRVSPGQPYRVNESGVPELFTDPLGNQMMLAPQGGTVTSPANMGMDGINLNFNVINQSPSSQFEVQSVNREPDSVTINAIVRDVQTGNGPVSRALKGNTNIQRRPK